MSLAFGAGARAVGGEDQTWSYAYEIAEGLGPFVGSHGPGGTFHVAMLTPTHLALIVIAYVLASRLWRWRPRRH